MALLHTRLLSIIDQARASVENGDGDNAVQLLELAIHAIDKATGRVPPEAASKPSSDQP